MRSLYWKIFILFWLATTLIILSTAWVTSEIAQKSSIPARERVFMDSYANAAVAMHESGHPKALIRWLTETGTAKQIVLYLLSSSAEIISTQAIPPLVKEISTNLINQQLDDDLIKFGNVVVSHEILSTSGHAYRLVAVSEKPLSHFIEIAWAGLTLRLTIAILISGLACYGLSLYLTRPLRSLRLAAQSIAKGNLSTRVGQIKGHSHDEIAELSDEFDRMAAKLESIMTSKERLLQDISHELRSPLARLQIAIELGKKKMGTLAEAELSRMERESLRLNDLIQEILEFARLEKPTYPVDKAAVNIVQLLQQIIEDASFESGDHQPIIVFKHAISVLISIDRRLMHRALENIIRNALRYASPHAKVSIGVQLDASKTTLHVIISDNGPGVPEEELTKIFNPFYRVDFSREKKTGGYGLGLAIAQQAIKLHEGRITATNRKKGGLRVKIHLPLSKNPIVFTHERQ